MRAYAITNKLFDGKQKVHHDQTIIQNEIDRQMDYGMRENMRKKSGIVYDSWLCGFLSQGIPGIYKILVVCGDDAVRVDRLANRDDLTISQAKEHIFARERKNVEKWKKMYAKEWREWVVKPGTVKKNRPVFYWYPEMYDLVIDTYKASKREAFSLAWSGLLKNQSSGTIR